MRGGEKIEEEEEDGRSEEWNRRRGKEEQKIEEGRTEECSIRYNNSICMYNI